jgi:hypothetical protein
MVSIRFQSRIQPVPQQLRRREAPVRLITFSVAASEEWYRLVNLIASPRIPGSKKYVTKEFARLETALLRGHSLRSSDVES